MTKILYIFGEDYAAVTFDNLAERGIVTAEELWNTAHYEGASCRYSEGDDVFEYQALLFEDVDSDFIAFVQFELVDYDASKTANIYVV
jgi:hypothetical protein